jgi:hypothetical protein
VRFDDRLRTVLDQHASDPHDRAVRWRQLVELVARSGEDADPDLLNRANSQIREDFSSVGERVRSAAALAIAPLILPADLVAIFASGSLSVAAPILASARLTASEWKHVSSSASDECRAFIGTMRSEQPVSQASQKRRAEDAADSSTGVPSISDVVARIERLRQMRETESEAPPPPAAHDESPRLFRWECNESGEIEWVDGAPRGAMVGRSIAQATPDNGLDRTVERAFAARVPFHEGTLELAGGSSVGGSWKISGIPAFDRTSGRFAGYRGIAERSVPAAFGSGAASDAGSHSLRELVHEIKTPLNAIIGFAEIITGEYLGPADSKFRERAGEIVAQARLLLTAIDDLDFAAKAHSAASEERKAVNLGKLVEGMIASLRETAKDAGVVLEASRTTKDLTVTVEPELAERLIQRMCAAMMRRGEAGEHFRLSVDNGGNTCRVSITRPASLRPLSDEELLGTGGDALAEGFTLRLVRGLARIAGAELVVSADSIALRFQCA